MEKFLAGRHFRIKCIFVYWSHQNLFCLSVLDKLNLRLTSGSKCYQTNKLFFCSSIAEVCVLRVSAILWAAYIRVINDKSLLQSWTAVYSETISSLWAYSQRWNVDQTFKKKKASQWSSSRRAGALVCSHNTFQFVLSVFHRRAGARPVK